MKITELNNKNTTTTINNITLTVNTNIDNTIEDNNKEDNKEDK